MKVLVNGETRELPDGARVREAIERFGPERHEKGVAAALNGEVVPKDAWSTTDLAEGDRLEVLVAIGGG